MFNYYEKVSSKDKFIMSVKEDGDYLVVTFADKSIIKLPNNQVSKKILKKQLEEQLDEILKKYPIENLKSDYERLKESHKKDADIITLIMSCLSSLIFLILIILLKLSFTSSICLGTLCSGMMFVTRLILGKKTLELVTLNSQIEEVQKIKLWIEENKKINQYVKKKAENTLNDQLVGVPKEQTEEIRSNILDEVRFSIYDLDKFSLEQLKQISKQIKLEQTYEDMIEEEIEKQKTIGTFQ